MTELWYEKITDLILGPKSDILFIVDPDNLCKVPEIMEIIQKSYPLILDFESDLKLRSHLRKEDKMLVIFKDNLQIPYHLLSKYANIEIGINDIFLLLDHKVLSSIPSENYQAIYTEYKKNEENMFDKLSKEETEDFIIKMPKPDYDVNQINALKSLLKEFIDKDNIEMNEWGTISSLLGEIMFISHKKDLENEFEKLKRKINSKFSDFVNLGYEDMLFYPNYQLNSNLLNIISEDNDKFALICFDCMGFEEWNILKRYLIDKIEVNFEIGHSFSILPSETLHSRLPIFSGLLPIELIEKNTFNLSYEEKLFKKAINKNLEISESDIHYEKCEDPSKISINYNSMHDFNVLGFIFTFIDELTHKAIDKRFLIEDIGMYLEKSNLDNFIQSLINQDFKIYLCSDHGSIHAKGNGISVSRDLVDTKARRYLKGIKELLEEYKTDNSIIKQFRNILGEEYLLLLIEDNMFSRKHISGLTHGGLSVEEVVVPFIEVKR